MTHPIFKSHGGVRYVSFDGEQSWFPVMQCRTWAQIERGSNQERCIHCSAGLGMHYGNCPKATPENRITGPSE